jgi:hypothetical protein
MNTVELSNKRLFKISMGLFQATPNLRPSLKHFLNKNWVTMGGNTGAGQGKNFKENLRIGDWVYITIGGQWLESIVEITSDWLPIPSSDRQFVNGDDWIYREFTIKYQPINKNLQDLKDYKFGWMPSANSTFHQISDFKKANQLLFNTKYDVNFIADTPSVSDSNLTQKDNKMPTFPLNQILYGPPGTGKTYHTINKALEILGVDATGKTRKELKDIFDTYVEAGQIVFTTFHQSMSYEDFIEGIKPETVDNSVIYEVKDGIFKRLCNIAKSNFESSKQENQNKSLFENVFQKLKDEWELNQGLKFPLTVPGYEFTIYEFTETSIRFEKSNGGRTHTLSINTLKELYYGKIIDFKQGVGIYYPPILNKLRSYKNEDAQKTQIEPYVLIIDEINRGNVSQIFGELITLIEEDKRLGNKEELRLTLPYSKDDIAFGVPPNLYIIGTMNTADRSVEALDTALRRRFSFVEMPPQYNLPELTTEIVGVKLCDILQIINNRIEVLLNKDNLIGHSYFLSVKDADDLKAVFQNKIMPLLQEYFFGDYGKIGMVLGGGFVEKKTADKSVFSDFEYDSGFEERVMFSLKDVVNMDDKDFKTAISTLINAKK